MTCAAATIVSKSRLALARVTAKSFLRHHPSTPFYVLLADRNDGFVDTEREPFETIELEELELDGLASLAFRYTEAEFSYSLTPHLARHLLSKGMDSVLFLKQETLVLDSLDSLFDALSRHSALLTPHLLEPGAGNQGLQWEINVLRSGVYNGGVLGFSRHTEAMAFLEWWRQRTEGLCLLAVEEGLHFEQRWLDFAPTLMPSLHVHRDPGVNVAHWNLPERQVAMTEDGRVTACGQPCSVFRFSGYDPDQPELTSRYNPDLSLDRSGAAARVYQRYHDLLMTEGHSICRLWPYAFDQFDNGVSIPELARRIYHQAGPQEFDDPFQAGADRSFYRWLISPPGMERNTPVTNFWAGIHRMTPELQRRFADPLGKDLAAFGEWIEHEGERRYGVFGR